MGGDAAAAAAASSQLQPQLANRDDGKRHKLHKKITEQDLRRRSSDEDQVSSFKEVNVQISS